MRYPFLLQKRGKGYKSQTIAVIFEDSENGVKAALAAGIKCFYIPDMKEIPEDLQAKTIKLRSLDEAINYIN